MENKGDSNLTNLSLKNYNVIVSQIDLLPMISIFFFYFRFIKVFINVSYKIFKFNQNVYEKFRKSEIKYCCIEIHP